jgi:hypothetical protein
LRRGHVDDVAYTTLYPQANSWCMGANVPGKPRVLTPNIGVIVLRSCAATCKIVMPGLVPGIHVPSYNLHEDMDGRAKPGHDINRSQPE